MAKKRKKNAAGQNKVQTAQPLVPRQAVNDGVLPAGPAQVQRDLPAMQLVPDTALVPPKDAEQRETKGGSERRRGNRVVTERLVALGCVVGLVVTLAWLGWAGRRSPSPMCWVRSGSCSRSTS
ncbi:hypothetical protein [Streptomyces mirabilis]|uniref:hypothetical protein n=1 Tax=Streptomyces mirabilis TaxID=68239 RepID=UPI0036C4DD5C